MPDKKSALLALLLRRFDTGQLGTFLWLRLGNKAAYDKLNTATAPSNLTEYALGTTVGLAKKNAINEHFRQKLRTARDGWIHKIDQIPDGGLAETYDFLLEAFTIGTLRHFILHTLEDESILTEIERARIFEGCVDQLVFQNAINDAFFDALLVERENCEAEIRAVQALWSTPPPQPQPQPTEDARPLPNVHLVKKTI